MFASVRTLAVSAALAGLALCAVPAQAFVYGGYHIMPTKSYAAKMAKLGHTPSGPMNYYGGSVFSSSKLVSVMWGSGVNSTIVSTIPGFSGAIVDSTYVDQMGEYSTKGVVTINGHKGTKQTITRGSYLGQVVITPKNQNTTLDDTDIQAEIKHQINIGALPPRDPNTLYQIYFPRDITITLDGLTSCVDFGAYHFATIDTAISKKKNIFYAVEPDCGSGISSITFAASHEFAEATTDNVPTPGSNPDFPQAWNDSAGFEVGDKCSGHGTLTATGGSWIVTQYYLNSKNGCSTGNYTSP
ncbi:MAG: hypothetical protein JOZ13_06895 [Alphaproteobacteria bacterium]|nr:hypothetical protein [Alphaproteobacteria bacterium]